MTDNLLATNTIHGNPDQMKIWDLSTLPLSHSPASVIADGTLSWELESPLINSLQHPMRCSPGFVFEGAVRQFLSSSTGVVELTVPLSHHQDTESASLRLLQEPRKTNWFSFCGDSAVVPFQDGRSHLVSIFHGLSSSTTPSSVDLLVPAGAGCCLFDPYRCRLVFLKPSLPGTFLICSLQ